MTINSHTESHASTNNSLTESYTGRRIVLLVHSDSLASSFDCHTESLAELRIVIPVQFNSVE